MKRFLPVLLLSLCAGCLAPATDGVSVDQGRLTVESPSFASRIELVQSQTKRIEGGFLKVQATLRNRERRDSDCQYRFAWKDSDGMTIKSAETVWKPLPLHGREEAVLEAVCPVPGAADFRLVVRPL